jgi:hypothetical protein
LFIHNFAKDDKKKAMMLLMPAQKKACHTVTYFVGKLVERSFLFARKFVFGSRSSAVS